MIISDVTKLQYPMIKNKESRKVLFFDSKRILTVSLGNNGIWGNSTKNRGTTRAVLSLIVQSDEMI